MSGIIDGLHRVLELSVVLEKGLRILGGVLHNPTPTAAADVLVAVRAIWDAIEGARVGVLTPAQAHAALDKLLADIAANDKRADTALDQKFPKG